MTAPCWPRAVAVVWLGHPQVNGGLQRGRHGLSGQRNVGWRWPWMNGGLLHARLGNAEKTDLFSLSRSWADLVPAPGTKQLSQPRVTRHRGTFHPSPTWACMASDRLMPSCRGHRRILAGGRVRAPAWCGQATLHLGERPMHGEPHRRHRVASMDPRRGLLKDLPPDRNDPEAWPSDVSAAPETEISTPTTTLQLHFDLPESRIAQPAGGTPPRLRLLAVEPDGFGRHCRSGICRRSWNPAICWWLTTPAFSGPLDKPPGSWGGAVELPLLDPLEMAAGRALGRPANAQAGEILQLEAREINRRFGRGGRRGGRPSAAG